MSAWDTAALDAAGLNLQAAFNLEDLPTEVSAEIRTRHDPAGHYRQLILIGHGGKQLWSAVQASRIESENPIDNFSIRTVEAWLATQSPAARHEIIYPGDSLADLQALGRLAGWHHDSPLKIGIHAKWGLWYAYRVVVLADTDFEVSRPETGQSPCDGCRAHACIAACPAGALGNGTLRLDKCVAYRKQPASLCKTTCLARFACPVGVEHRYCDEQIRHTYAISLRTIEQYY